MSTATILLLINAAFFLCIIGITIGIVVFNWGDSIKIKHYKLNGILLIIVNGLLIYFFCVPMSNYYTNKIFLEKEYSGVVVQKIIEKHNHNTPFIYFQNISTDEKIGIPLNKIAYRKVSIGDTLTKSINEDFLQINNKQKDLMIPKEELIFP